MNDITDRLIAHRGESFLAPENSLSAINLAWKQGAHAVEVDVHLTLDKQIVVIHDNHTGRVGNRKLIIKKTKLSELKHVDIGVKKAPEFSGQKIPTLSELLETVPLAGKLIIEVKCGKEIIEPLMQLIKSTKLQYHQIEFISFNLELIATIKKHLPHFKALWLLDLDYYLPHWLLRTKPLKIINKIEANSLNGANVWAGKIIDKSFVLAFKEKGLLLYTWTVNDPKFARELLNIGVDAITTDRAQWLNKQITGITQ
jgi:glycerophosphoryl diester phosphodiesterase